MNNNNNKYGLEFLLVLGVIGVVVSLAEVPKLWAVVAVMIYLLLVGIGKFAMIKYEAHKRRKALLSKEMRSRMMECDNAQRKLGACVRMVNALHLNSTELRLLLLRNTRALVELKERIDHEPSRWNFLDRQLMDSRMKLQDLLKYKLGFVESNFGQTDETRNHLLEVAKETFGKGPWTIV